MKKIIIIIISLLLSFQFGAKAQWVTIPDAHFVAYLQANFPSCMNGNLMDTTCAGITGATSINIYNDSISDLTGIQFFDGLDTLYCTHNLFISLPTLPNSLTYLYWQLNLITSLPLLPNSLQILNCEYNQLTNLPILPNSIINFNCSNNLITSLPLLPNSIQSIICSNNQLSSLPALPNSLTTLGCTNNFISVLPTLPNSLQILNCSYNQLTNIPALPTSLDYINCNSNLLTNLPTLPNSLSQLLCDYNQLTSLPILPNSLTLLDCYQNQLISLPQLPSTLQLLQCQINQLTSLPSLPNSLLSLACFNNNISCFPVFPNSLTFSSSFTLTPNPVHCLPNYRPGMNSTYLAMPLCVFGDTLNNPNGCINANGIVGFCFNDTNNNCLKDTTDIVLINIHEQIYDNANSLIYQTFSLTNGIYDIPEPTGTYTVKIDTVGMPFTIHCNYPGVDSMVTLTSANPLQTNVNFSIDCKPGFDIGVQSVIHNGIIFPGQHYYLKLIAGDFSNWYNLHCASGISGQVVISISGPITYFNNLGTLIPTINGNVYTYNIADFGTINSSTAFGLVLSTDTTANFGDTICVNVSVTPTNGDNNISNNTYNLCYLVGNSFDPNYKETYPEQVQPGFDDYFTYTVHFQNTGSAAAINISLQDTLDANLDLNTFQVINYSHYNTTWLTGNKLSFNFPNIQLADSSTDFNGSQGFVQYRIKPLANLPAGTLIHNRASIYFDYNAPVLTNTTTNEFMLGVGVPSTIKASTISIYPNPSSGVFRIDAGNNKLKEIKVTDVLGRIVLVTNINSSNTTIDLSKETKGVYFIQLSDENNNRVNKKIIIE